MPEPPNGPHPGDTLIPGANMNYDQTRLVHAPAAEIWPWILQLGKGRAGWYTPSSLASLLPSSFQASQSLNSSWQNLRVGDVVPDYGFSSDDYFVVAAIEPEKALVYRSERYGAEFSWALLLHDVSEGKTIVHLRFRGRVAVRGLRRRLIVWGGGWADYLSTAPMLKGLEERAVGYSRGADDRG